MAEITPEAWIEAGFEEIARSGVEGVRVEVLAKNLGVTKGGFYRRFRDRAALLGGMLQSWSGGRIAAIEKQTSLDGATARERLRALIALYSERMNTEGMAVELAIRQWAAVRRGCRRGGGQRRCRAAEECRPSLSRHRPARRKKPMRRHSCSTASSSAKACCFSNAARASARS